MPRLSLLLLTVAAVAAGGANLYLGGAEALLAAEHQLDDRLDRAAKSLRTVLAEEARRDAAAEGPEAAPAAAAGGAAEANTAKASRRVFDDPQAKRLAALVGADVTLVRAGKAEASSLSQGLRAEIASATGSAAAASFGVGELPATEFELFGLPLPLFASSRASLRAHGASVPGLDQVEAVLSVSTLDAFAAVAADQKRNLFLTAGLALLGLLLIVTTRRGGGAGLRSITEVAERAADGDPAAHAAEFHPGDLGRLARALNRLISRSKQAAGAKASSAQFTLPQAGEPPADVEDAFPFGSSQAPPSGAALGAAAPSNATPGPSVDAGSPGPSFDPGFAGSAPGISTSAFGTAAGSIGEAFEQTAPGTLEAKLPPDEGASAWESPAAAADPGRGGASWDQPTRLSQGDQGFVPPPPAPPSPSISGGPDAYSQAIAEATGGEYNPEATVVAAIPEALLRATSRSTVAAAPVVDPEETHLQEVFQEFLRLRQECGEPIAGLSFEKFAVKLRANRKQLVEKYQCRTVRFTAYIKDGKAALKASPMRD